MKIDLTKPAPENCLSWNFCQHNDCPLEPKPNSFRTLKEDKALWGYHKCRCTKAKRMQIAKAYNMKSLGLTMKELDNMRKSMRMKQEMLSTQRKEIRTPVAHTGKEGLE